MGRGLFDVCPFQASVCDVYVCTSLYVIWQLLPKSTVCRFLGEMRQWLHLYLHSKTIKMRQTWLSTLTHNSVCFPFFKLSQPQTVASYAPSSTVLWVCLLFFFLLCSDLPCLLRCLTILLRWPLNSFIITPFFVLFQPPSHTLPWEAFFVFCFAVTVNKEFVSSLITLSF